MSSGIFVDKIYPPPELLYLDVIRDEYCSQEQVDVITAYLWEYKPELIAELAEFEKEYTPTSARTTHHKKICDWIIEELLENTPKSINLPETYLGRLDLLYEISRRIRASLNLPEIKPLEASLSKDRADTSKYPKLFTENEFIAKLYNKYPEKFFDYAEQIRLSIYSYEVTSALQKVIWDNIPDKEKNNPKFLGNNMQYIAELLYSKIEGEKQ